MIWPGSASLMTASAGRLANPEMCFYRWEPLFQEGQCAESTPQASLTAGGRYPGSGADGRLISALRRDMETEKSCNMPCEDFRGSITQDSFWVISAREKSTDP